MGLKGRREGVARPESLQPHVLILIDARISSCLSRCDRAIATSLGLSKGSVNNYVSRARRAGLEWPLPEGLDDDSLELLLFPDLKSLPTPERPVPDWSLVDRELRKRNVTRALLWQEYRAQYPHGFGYSWFCDHFDAWKGRVRPSMRQTHVGGEKVFVDFAGDKIDIVDPDTGEVHTATDEIEQPHFSILCYS